MRHAAARQYHRFQSERGDGSGYRLAEGIAALHRWLRRQIGVDIDRQHRPGMTEMGQWDADGIIDLCRRGKCRIEVLTIKLAHQLKPDLARNFPVKFSAGKFATGFTSDVNRKRRGSGVKE